MDRIGRYKIVRELGRGAMGVVYHAIDPNIGRPVAIKTIQLTDVRNPEEQKRLRERLFREARSAGMLSHPGIVTIYDVAEQDGLAYIAMEYVDGPTLEQTLSDPQLMTSETMFSILGQTASALDYAHGKGIVHRDIKPANIMIARDGTAKITDFGIAKITTSEQYTMTGNIVGTPHYMSPEQVQGLAVDGRSDQFSLAVIAYEMLTGEKPYTGEHLTTVVYKIVAEEPPLPHRINPTLSAAIEGALKKALAKKADARYRTCSEFAGSLERACAATKGWKLMTRGASYNEPTLGEAPRAATMMPPARRPHRATDTGEDTAAVSSTATGAKRKSGFLTFLMAVLMAGLLLAVIGWQAAPWLTGDRQTPKPPEAHAAKPAETPAAPLPTAAPPVVVPPSVPAPANAADAKPSPLGPAPKPVADNSAAASTAGPTPGGAPAAAVQQVSIVSSPGGATVRMDERPDATCQTPCSLDAAPGRHRISLTMDGYQTEHREFDVGRDALELPLLILRAQTGDLMLTSVPKGAAVLVNGKKIEQNTPAQLHLAPGSYKITVEKDGQQGTGTVDLKAGDFKTLNITLGR